MMNTTPTWTGLGEGVMEDEYSSEEEGLDAGSGSSMEEEFYAGFLRQFQGPAGSMEWDNNVFLDEGGQSWFDFVKHNL